MKSSAIFFPLLALAVGFAGCTKHGEPAADATAGLPSVKVRVATVRLENLPMTTEVTGTVRPVQHAALSPKVMGSIAEFPVTLGQAVKAGDLLVKITAAEISARLAQAQSQLKVARRDLERERDLLTKGASTAEMVRGLEDRAALTAAMVHEGEAMLSYTEIRAPFDGIVTRKNANVGDLTAPGQPLLELEGQGGFEVETGIPDQLAGSLAVGGEISVMASATDAAITGRLSALSSAADPQARTVAAKIALPAGRALRSGEFVRVLVPGARVNILLVPATAVSVLGQMERVFVAGADNRAMLRLVKTGATHGDRVEILAGLDDGERVILSVPAGLREGQPLEMQP